MKNQTKTKEVSRLLKCRSLSGRRFTDAEVSVIMEKELPIYINDRHLVTASIAPGLEKEFAAGYLYSQGFTADVKELEAIRIETVAARITLSHAAEIIAASAKSGGRIVSGGGKALYSSSSGLTKIDSELKVGKEEIFKAMSVLFDRAAIYKQTEGTHAAGLFTVKASPVVIAEDIGRHNALDKVIGYALLNNVNFASVFLATTGRLASEMALKAVRAGIPVAATKTAVTDEALNVAARYGLTVIGFVREAGTTANTDMETRVFKESGLNIYTGAGRITDN